MRATQPALEEDVLAAVRLEESASSYTVRGDGFDVVVLDIKMPKMDGIEVLRRIDHAAALNQQHTSSCRLGGLLLGSGEQVESCHAHRHAVRHLVENRPLCD